MYHFLTPANLMAAVSPFKISMSICTLQCLSKRRTSRRKKLKLFIWKPTLINWRKILTSLTLQLSIVKMWKERSWKSEENTITPGVWKWSYSRRNQDPEQSDWTSSTRNWASPWTIWTKMAKYVMNILLNKKLFMGT
jgi:hypothetical protein